MTSTNNHNQEKSTRKTSKVIYNPFAGEKRKVVGRGHTTTIEEIKQLFTQYQIDADFFPTQYAGHASELAANAKNEGYTKIIAIGGDGTVGEVAQGIVGTDMTLGIIPLGTYMNTARMFGLPLLDVEKCVMLLKLGRVRKIDVGCITHLSGEEVTPPHYFLESAAIGFEAQFHHYFSRIEKEGIKHLFSLIKTFFDYYGYKVMLEIDDQIIKRRALSINIANGPYAGAALKISPEAKLNDHMLTITIYRMNVWSFTWYLIKLLTFGKIRHDKMETFQGNTVTLKTVMPRLFHADARTFGKTPVTIAVQPQALCVITGFPKIEESSFKERTYLAP